MNAPKLPLIALCMILSPVAALAQSEADKDACTPDVFRLCGDYIPDEGPIVQCLKTNGPRLSSACHAVMFRGEPAAVEATAETGAKKLRKHRAKRHHRAVHPPM